jgi:hypothetical protein
MPNPIKYTIGSETDALKKGNFYIGTGSVEKGPTSSTGYYNGITPQSGGYTIYLNKETGGPSIYTASNDAQLISLTNSIAVQNYTTIQECFNYFYSQNDKLLVNQDYPVNYPYIVMDGLVLNLDAGITQSYPTTGTTWTDINGLGPRNNGTLTNGPTFNSANGGSIVFDGIDDFVNCGILQNQAIGTSPRTMQSWVYLTTYPTNTLATILGYGSNTGGAGRLFMLTVLNTGNIFMWGNSNNYTSPLTLDLNTWTNVAITVTPGVTFPRITIYKNGIADNGSEVNINTVSDICTIGYGGNFYGVLNGRVPTAYIYNRALSTSEILQNYNATKSRYGL